jgi:hypothetical protein
MSTSAGGGWARHRHLDGVQPCAAGAASSGKGPPRFCPRCNCSCAGCPRGCLRCIAICWKAASSESLTARLTGTDRFGVEAKARDSSPSRKRRAVVRGLGISRR